MLEQSGALGLLTLTQTIILAIDLVLQGMKELIKRCEDRLEQNGLGNECRHLKALVVICFNENGSVNIPGNVRLQ